MGKIDESPASFLFGVKDSKETKKETPKPTKKTQTKPKATTTKTEKKAEDIPTKTETAPEMESEDDIREVWRKLPVKKKEHRDRRVQLCLTPSLYEWLRDKVDREGSNVNDYLNRLLETIRDAETTPKRRRRK